MAIPDENLFEADAPELTASEALYNRALQVLPGGCSRNTVLREPHPIYAAYGKGCYVTDVEGVERIDFANNMASLIHGHAFSPVVDAVNDQLKRGTAYTLATEVEIQYAEELCERVPGFEMIRFVNSGTEAVMGAIKASRAFTGRPKIAKVEGAYHGSYDFAEVSQTSTPSNWGEVDKPASVPVSFGTPRSALDDVVIIPFNDPRRAVQILEEHASELACVLVDLIPHRVGLMPATDQFLAAIRDWTSINGSLLVCDEVITFRNAFGGAQQNYSVRPDLTALGKMIGGGFPVGALAGRHDVMSVMDPLRKPLLFPHSGTFSANPITMIAGSTAMKYFDKVAVDKLNVLGDRVRKQIEEVIRLADVRACVTGSGSMFRILMKQTPPENYRDAFANDDEVARLKFFLDFMFANGVMLISTGTGMLSTAMRTSEIDWLTEVVLDGLIEIRRKFGQ